MTTQHSEIFYYAIAVYAIGAAAILALPSGSQPQTEASSHLTLPLAGGPGTTADRKAEMAAKVMPAAATPTAVRNSVASQASGFVFAGTPAKF